MSPPLRRVGSFCKGVISVLVFCLQACRYFLALSETEGGQLEEGTAGPYPQWSPSISLKWMDGWMDGCMDG